MKVAGIAGLQRPYTAPLADASQTMCRSEPSLAMIIFSPPVDGLPACIFTCTSRHNDCAATFVTATLAAATAHYPAVLRLIRITGRARPAVCLSVSHVRTGS